MPKNVNLKILIAIFAVLAIVVSALGFSVSYAKWVNGKSSNLSANAQIGEWTSFYGVVLLDEAGKETGTVFPLAGDNGGNGGDGETYTGSFTVESNDTRFKVYYDNKPVSHALKVGQSNIANITKPKTEDATIYQANESGTFSVSVAGGAEGGISFMKQPISLSGMKTEDLNMLLGGNPGIVTSSGKVIPIPDFTKGESIDVNLTGGEEFVIIVNNDRAHTDIWHGVSQYSINDNGLWEASKDGNNVAVIKGEEEKTYTVSIGKGLLGANQVLVQLKSNPT